MNVQISMNNPVLCNIFIRGSLPPQKFSAAVKRDLYPSFLFTKNFLKVLDKVLSKVRNAHYFNIKQTNNINLKQLIVFKKLFTALEPTEPTLILTSKKIV